MRQIKVILPKDQSKPSMKDKKEMKEWLNELLNEDEHYSRLQRGPRYKFTKVFIWCEECHETLDVRNDYHARYGTCDSSCYMRMVGMSWSDFI